MGYIVAAWWQSDQINPYLVPINGGFVSFHHSCPRRDHSSEVHSGVYFFLRILRSFEGCCFFISPSLFNDPAAVIQDGRVVSWSEFETSSTTRLWMQDPWLPLSTSAKFSMSFFRWCVSEIVAYWELVSPVPLGGLDIGRGFGSSSAASITSIGQLVQLCDVDSVASTVLWHVSTA